MLPAGKGAASASATSARVMSSAAAVLLLRECDWYDAICSAAPSAAAAKPGYGNARAVPRRSSSEDDGEGVVMPVSLIMTLAHASAGLRVRAGGVSGGVAGAPERPDSAAATAVPSPFDSELRAERGEGPVSERDREEREARDSSSSSGMHTSPPSMAHAHARVPSRTRQAALPREEQREGGEKKRKKGGNGRKCEREKEKVSVEKENRNKNRPQAQAQTKERKTEKGGGKRRETRETRDK